MGSKNKLSKKTKILSTTSSYLHVGYFLRTEDTVPKGSLNSPNGLLIFLPHSTGRYEWDSRHLNFRYLHLTKLSQTLCSQVRNHQSQLGWDSAELTEMSAPGQTESRQTLLTVLPYSHLLMACRNSSEIDNYNYRCLKRSDQANLPKWGLPLQMNYLQVMSSHQRFSSEMRTLPFFLASWVPTSIISMPK